MPINSDRLQEVLASVDRQDSNAWLLLSNRDDRAHAGNEGYEDETGRRYLWDNTVANHAKIKTDDVIVIWDKKKLIGTAVAQVETPTHGEKIRFRCPFCASTKMKKRTSKSPLFKCGNQICKETFEKATEEKIEVMNYAANYNSSWIPLVNFLDDKGCRELAQQLKSQHSMRPIDKAKLRTFLTSLQ